MNGFRIAPWLFLATALVDVSRAQDAPTPASSAPDEPGFERLFDGKSLAGWEGDPKYWRVEQGVLVGEVTPETILEQNSFVIWRGGTPADFELKLDYRVTASGNSGINYRSVPFEGAPFALKGYQADLHGGDRHTGQAYEEKGRTFLAKRGEVVRLLAGAPPQVIGSVGDPAVLQSFIKKEDWNEYHIVARGNVLTHILNGHVMCIVFDDDETARRADGLIGVQVHVGPPMKIEYRNIRLKTIRR